MCLALRIARRLHRLDPGFRRPVMARQQPCRGLAHLPNAEGVDEAVEADGAALLDRLEELRHRLPAPAFA